MDQRPETGYKDLTVYCEALPSQLRFWESSARFKGFSGPIGSGKSLALVVEAIRLSCENQGRWGLLGAPTYQMLRDSTQKALFEVLEENNFVFEYHKAENTVTFREWGSKILLRSMDDAERLRGTNLAWFGIDELTYSTEDVWLRLEGRLRDPKAKELKGFAVWTPKGFDWVYRKFIRDESGNYDVVQAQPFENRHLLKAVPDFYERLQKSYDGNFYEQEVLGSYLTMTGGLVYRNFNRQEHLTPAEIDPTKPLLWAMDFNVDPLCSVVAQMHGNTVYVVDEIVMSRATTEQACDEMFRRYRTYMNKLTIYGDASGNNQHTTGSSDYKVIRDFFRRVGVQQPEQRVPTKNPFVRDRVTAVNTLLKNSVDEIHLYVDPRCKELIRDFEELAFKEGTTIPDKTKDMTRSHLSDALGYLIWQEYQTGKTGERSGRLF